MLTQYRYVLRNKKTNDVYLVVVFSLYLKEDLNDDGSLKVPEEEAKRKAVERRPSDAPEEGEGVEPGHEGSKQDRGMSVGSVD